MELTHLLALAGNGAPLVDIDGTFFLQLLLFLAIAAFLNQLLFKPFLRMKAAREAGIEGARAEAARLDEEARTRVQDYELKIGVARKDADGERQTLHAEAVHREREIHEAAVRQTHSSITSSRARLEEEAARIRQELAAKSSEIAERITEKVLGRANPTVIPPGRDPADRASWGPGGSRIPEGGAA